jgi:hypothetical protein
VGVTAVSEELIFRGFIWDRMKRAGWSTALIIAPNVISFTLWHILAILTTSGRDFLRPQERARDHFSHGSAAREGNLRAG